MFSSLRSLTAILMVVIALLALSVVANAQTITGSISGAVTDANGGMVPNATVTLSSEKTGQARGSTTDSEGRFSFPALQPGTYALKVERQGFQTLEQRGVIRGYRVHLDSDALDLPLTAFVSIKPTDPSALDDAPARLAHLKAIEACHSVAGDESYILKVRVVSPAALELLLQEIRAAANVSTRTTVVLSTPYESRPPAL